MKPQTADDINSSQTGRFILFKRNPDDPVHVPHKPVHDWPKFRFILFDPDTKRLELEGMFTAQDLRNLADWLESDNKPCIPGLPMIDVKLSPL